MKPYNNMKKLNWKKQEEKIDEIIEITNEHVGFINNSLISIDGWFSIEELNKIIKILNT